MSIREQLAAFCGPLDLVIEEKRYHYIIHDMKVKPMNYLVIFKTAPPNIDQYLEQLTKWQHD